RGRCPPYSTRLSPAREARAPASRDRRQEAAHESDARRARRRTADRGSACSREGLLAHGPSGRAPRSAGGASAVGPLGGEGLPSSIRMRAVAPAVFAASVAVLGAAAPPLPTRRVPVLETTPRARPEGYRDLGCPAATLPDGNVCVHLPGD